MNRLVIGFSKTLKECFVSYLSDTNRTMAEFKYRSCQPKPIPTTKLIVLNLMNEFLESTERNPCASRLRVYFYKKKKEKKFLSFWERLKYLRCLKQLFLSKLAL